MAREVSVTVVLSDSEVRALRWAYGDGARPAPLEVILATVTEAEAAKALERYRKHVIEQTKKSRPSARAKGKPK